MINSAKAGWLISKIYLINGRKYHKFLSLDKRAKFNSEQGKILYCLWKHTPQTTTDLSLITGLAKNTLTSMLNRLEEKQLIYSYPHPIDKRKIYFDLTKQGKAQYFVGQNASKQLSEVFYKNFTEEETKKFEEYLERILENLKNGGENV